MVQILFHPRAVEAVVHAYPQVKDRILEVLKLSSNGSGEWWVTSSVEWEKHTEMFDEICQALVVGWKTKREGEVTASDTIDMTESSADKEEMKKPHQTLPSS
jgi:hypothetical protein